MPLVAVKLNKYDIFTLSPIHSVCLLTVSCLSGGRLTVVQAVDRRMQPEFWPVSVDHFAACPWLQRVYSPA